MYRFIILAAIITTQSCSGFQRKKTMSLSSANHQLTKSDISITIEKPNSNSPSSIRFKANQGYYMTVYLKPDEAKTAKDLFGSDYNNGDNQRFELIDDLQVQQYSFKPQADRMQAGYIFLYKKFTSELEKNNDKIKRNNLEIAKSNDGSHKNVLKQVQEYLENVGDSFQDMNNGIKTVLVNKYKEDSK